MKPLHCKNGTFYEHSVVKNIYIVVKFQKNRLVERIPTEEQINKGNSGIGSKL